MTDSGFSQGQSDNLPMLDSIMMASFFGNNSDFVSAEVRGCKALRSARETYGDNAIGYVQVKRHGTGTGMVCTVKARITPEHRVRSKAYTVVLTCDEAQDIVTSVKCEDCTASLGGCKHAIAFLTWLHRRSEEPPVTSVICYWKKSKLSSVGTSIKLIKAKELGKHKMEELLPGDGSILKTLMDESKDRSIKNQLTKYFHEPPVEVRLSIHRLFNRFQTSNNAVTASAFLDFCRGAMDLDLCIKIEKATRQQSDCPLWFEMRYCRITASKAYEAAHCTTMEGTLVESILGALKLKDTMAMKRGGNLEPEVVAVLSKKLKVKLNKCGFLLDSAHPVLGASPDAICENFVVEVKCPTTENAMKRYFTSDGRVAAKHLAQLQLQMFFAKKQRGIFCVACHSFETTKKTTEIYVDFDLQYCTDVLNKCTAFWSNAIFPFLNK